MAQSGNGEVKREINPPTAQPKTRVLSAEDWPWSTQDAILAFCLYMAGAEFSDEKHPCICEYTLANLQGLARNGLPVAGKPIEEAVDIAVARKKKGSVHYGFKATDKLKRLLEAYQRQVKEIETGLGTAAELMLQLVEGLRTNRYPIDEFLLQINCVSMKMRVQFMDLWQEHVFIRIDNQGQESVTKFHDVDAGGRQREGKIVKKPGFKIFPRHAGKKLREEMNL